MNEFSRHIEEYSNYWYSAFSTLVPSDQWGDKRIAEAYLKKYWLPKQEYLSVWKPVQDQVFVPGMSLPKMIYHPVFDVIALGGGCLFVEQDFKLLQEAMLEIGNEYFFVIQNSQDFTKGEPAFRMKFPVNISWEELMSGNYISAVLFEMSYNEYFVFGDTGRWGRYSANDNDFPLEIIGFVTELACIFQERFKQSKEEQEQIRDWLPQEYRVKLRLNSTQK